MKYYDYETAEKMAEIVKIMTERPERNPNVLINQLPDSVSAAFERHDKAKRDMYREADRLSRPPVGVMPRWRRIELTVMDLIRAHKEFLHRELYGQAEVYFLDALAEAEVYLDIYLKGDPSINTPQDALNHIIKMNEE